MFNPTMQSLKFRAVDPETGRVLTYADFSNPMMDSIEFTAAGSRFYQPAKKGAILCQFTGLTDYSGQEVYAGDVLMLGSFLYVTEWADDLCGYAFMALPNQPGMELIYTSIDAHEVASSRLVGNIWEPDETLRKRAVDMKRAKAERGGI